MRKGGIIKVNVTPVFLLAFLLVASITLAQGINSANYKIPYSAVDSGGGNISSGNYFLEISTEPIGGNSSSSNYNVCLGINCCPADVISKFLNTTLDTSTNAATIHFALWHPDICMGITNVTVQCAANCNPCTQSCSSVSTTQQTLSLTDVLIARNTISLSDPNVTNPIYCRVTDDTFNLERCFNTPTNLTVTVEAGGPYSGTSATVIVAGNTTFDDGTTVGGANVTVDLYRATNLTNILSTVATNSSEDGKFSAQFYNLGVDSYLVNVTARYQNLVANTTDSFGVLSIYGNCQLNTIALSGKALDATTGEKIPSGTASLTVQETGDKKDTTITDGAWSTSLVACTIPGQTYTVTVRITDNLGKVSWSELKFTSP